MVAYLFCRLIWWSRAPAGVTRITGTVGIALIASLVVTGVGLSRVYLGVHYPSDVIAGLAAGGIWLLAAVVSTEVLRSFHERRAQRRSGQ
jgi:membrane-associated phospholipid phosphatase